jgi:hypothetical protein
VSVQRMAAHPLVVAVALGLLGPDALSTLPNPQPQRRLEERGETEPERDLLAFGLGDLEEEPTGREIDPDEFARVEREWYEARLLKPE